MPKSSMTQPWSSKNTKYKAAEVSAARTLQTVCISRALTKASHVWKSISRKITTFLVPITITGIFLFTQGNKTGIVRTRGRTLRKKPNLCMRRTSNSGRRTMKYLEVKRTKRLQWMCTIRQEEKQISYLDDSDKNDINERVTFITFELKTLWYIFLCVLCLNIFMTDP